MGLLLLLPSRLPSYMSVQSSIGTLRPVVQIAILSCCYFQNKCLVFYWQIFSEEIFKKQEKQKNINKLQWLMPLNKYKGERHRTIHFLLFFNVNSGYPCDRYKNDSLQESWLN